jgi:hypothetical protein
MKQRFLFAFFALLLPFLTTAQVANKQVTAQHIFWAADFCTLKFSPKWSLMVDLQHRRVDGFNKTALNLGRSILFYQVHDNLSMGAGAATIAFYPNLINAAFDETRPEFRSFQRVVVRQKIGRVRFQHWYTLEQRFLRKVENNELAAGSIFSNRFRYFVNVQCPIGRKEIDPGTLFFSGFNELFFSFGKNVGTNAFDQNRIFLGLGYQFNKSFNAQVGYLNVWQQSANGPRFTDNNGLRIALLQNLDLSKKVEKK